ncbi:MAG: biopolymer transporter ExbD [Phycisphaerales bacterium]|nr:biopolymer transporter ExbD [Phycisphaerales bacterium]
MSLLHARGAARIDCNLTPMIDLAFLLIVFFVLVARMGGDQAPTMALPEPHHAALSPQERVGRIAVNVLADDGGASVTVGAMRFGTADADIDRIAEAIAQRLRADPSLKVDVRADRSLPYREVEPALKAIAQAVANQGSGAVTVRVCALDAPGRRDG